MFSRKAGWDPKGGHKPCLCEGVAGLRPATPFKSDGYHNLKSRRNGRFLRPRFKLELLCATQKNSLCGGFAAQKWLFEDGEASSSKGHHIDTIISHTWHTSWRKKFGALSFQNSICFSLAHVVSLLTGALVSTFAALQVLAHAELSWHHARVWNVFLTGHMVCCLPRDVLVCPFSTSIILSWTPSAPGLRWQAIFRNSLGQARQCGIRTEISSDVSWRGTPSSNKTLFWVVWFQHWCPENAVLEGPDHFGPFKIWPQLAQATFGPDHPKPFGPENLGLWSCSEE